MALLILAGLQLISADVYEAAKVDGASAWQRFTAITLPLVKPALMVALLFRTLDVLRMYDLPAIMTGGGAGDGNDTTTLSILVVDEIAIRVQQRRGAVDDDVHVHLPRGVRLHQVPGRQRGRSTTPAAAKR